jgi:hypothetical protein
MSGGREWEWTVEVRRIGWSKGGGGRGEDAEVRLREGEGISDTWHRESTVVSACREEDLMRRRVEEEEGKVQLKDEGRIMPRMTYKRGVGAVTATAMRSNSDSRSNIDSSITSRTRA